MLWIFGSFLAILCTLTSCHIVICKQDSTIRAVRSNRWPRDENQAVRLRQSAENRSWVRDMRPIRGVSDELARGCKCWHPLAPGRRYEKKKSSLWDMSLHQSLKQQQTVRPLKNKMRDIFIEKCVSFIRCSCKSVLWLWLYNKYLHSFNYSY